jgi:EAL domain-containing protein (putative c-di-GMP-specific phosphodiesterase class I)
MVPAGQTLSEHFVQHERQFMELLSGRGLTAMVQPIVRAGSSELFAYELLGRGNHPDLPTSPVTLFHLAALLHREAELSAAFRDYGTAVVAPRLAGSRLFVNTHPSETFAESFFAGLTRLRAMPGAPRLVVEVHETAVMEVERMRELKARLDAIGVELAYDDFGAGQARLNELGEVPPHFVKFDMALIHRIHEASDTKQRLVSDLVRLVGELGSATLAEGVEMEAEAEVCRAMGFQLIQGYLTGRPVPVQSI